MPRACGVAAADRRALKLQETGDDPCCFHILIVHNVSIRHSFPCSLFELQYLSLNSTIIQKMYGDSRPGNA